MYNIIFSNIIPIFVFDGKAPSIKKITINKRKKQKEINQIRQQLVDSPITHIDARAAILSDIALSREFAHTFLQGLC